MKLSLLAPVLLLFAGCVRTGAGLGLDGRIADGPRADVALPDAALPDAPTPDAPTPDAPTPDAPLPDAGPPCVSKPDPDTLLLYTFSGGGSTVTDTAGKHHGTVVGSAVTRVPGPQGCGTGVVFPNAVTDYVLVPDSPDWDLAQGSVDLRLRVDTPTSTKVRGFVSRDAHLSDKPGHLSMFQLPDGGVAVRLQHSANTGAVRCSPPLSFGVWHHVGVNFGAGGLQLFVDGVEAKRTDTVTTTPLSLSCGSSSNLGIAGNDNPWVLGTSAHQSAEGSALPTSYPFDGAIDSFRVSKVRRAFGKTP